MTAPIGCLDGEQAIRDALAAGPTPGPWRSFNHSWSDTSILAVDFDHAVCLLDINYATEESQEADEAVMAANARLISACHPETMRALLAELDRLRSASRQEGWISVDERLPEIGEAALVYTPPQPEDWPDTVRISIDHISPDYEYWNDHAESYEHWCCVGKPEGSVGPKEKAPYTHWMPIPTPPAPHQSQEAQGDRHGE